MLVLTLVAADAFEADAAVTGSRHVVTCGVVHALTQLLAAVAESPGWTLWDGKDGGGAHTHTVSFLASVTHSNSVLKSALQKNIIISISY